MRIGFVERLLPETMTEKPLAAAQRRHGLVFGGLEVICLTAWQLAPIDRMTVERRGTEVPLAVPLPAMGLLFFGLAALILLSRDRQ